MENTLVDALLYQLNMGAIINGTFTSIASYQLNVGAILDGTFTSRAHDKI